MKKASKDVGTIIGRGCSIKDNTINAVGPIMFEGDFSGKVNCQAEVTIGPHGYVDGNIISDVITVAGRFEGDLKANTLVHIEPSGIVSGHVRTDKIVIDEGGTLNGNVDMDVEKKLVNASTKGGENK